MLTDFSSAQSLRTFTQYLSVPNNYECVSTNLWSWQWGSWVQRTASSSPSSSDRGSRPLRWRSTESLLRTGPSLRRRTSPHPPTRQTSVPLHPLVNGPESRGLRPEATAFLQSRSEGETRRTVSNSRENQSLKTGGGEATSNQNTAERLTAGPHSYIIQLAMQWSPLNSL